MKALFEGVLQNSNTLKGNVEESIKADIDETVNNVVKKWQQLASDLSTSLKTLESLEEILTECDMFDLWITDIRDKVLCFQTSQPSALQEIELILSEMQTKKENWKSVESRSCLHILHPSADADADVSKRLNRKTFLVGSNLDGLESYIICIHQYLSLLYEERKALKEKIVDLEIHFKDAQKSLEDNTCEYEEINDQMDFIEAQLENISLELAFLQHSKRIMSFNQMNDLFFVNKLTEMTLQAQTLISKYSSQYIKLIEESCRKSFMSEKIILFQKCCKKCKILVPLLQSGEYQNEYSESLKIFIQCKMSELYVHCQRNLLKSIIKDYMNVPKETCIESINAVKECWDALENWYEVNSAEVMNVILLWENYLLHLYQSKIHLHKLKTGIKALSGIVHQREMDPFMSEIKKSSSLVRNIKNLIQAADAAGHELQAVINPEFNLSIEEAVSNLNTNLNDQEKSLQILFSKLQTGQNLLEDVHNQLDYTKNELKTTFTLANVNYQLSCKELNTETTKAKIEGMNSTCSILKKLQSEVESLSILCPIYSEEIFVQNQFSVILLLQLQELLFNIQSHTENLFKFRKSTKLMGWFDQTEKRIHSKHFGSLEKAKQILKQDIGRDISEKQTLFASLEHDWIKSEMEEENIADICSSLSVIEKNFISLQESFSNRLQKLSKDIEIKKKMRFNLSELRQFLKSQENTLNSLLSLEIVSREELHKRIDSVEAIELQIDQQAMKVNTLNTNLKDLIANVEAFECSQEKNMFFYSFQHLFQRYEAVKFFTLEKLKRLRNSESLLNNILNLLEKLEQWLASKEKLASETNYEETNHSRSTLLKGIKLFEDLNHDIQDNVQLLHDVNAAFHTASREELNIGDAVKNRVVSANNKWRVFYEEVSKTLEVIKNVLQMWEDYDTAKEHLLLILTEKDMELTKILQKNVLSQDEYTSILNEIYLHEEELLKFTSLSSHLKALCQCSTPTIESDVKNIQIYWEEIIKRLSELKDCLPMEIESKSFDIGAEGVAIDEQSGEEQLTSQKESNIQRCADELDECSPNEYIKDLIAALEEAEQRIESLEDVLSEPTPTGVDEENAPNYSRLLAACRSSIDVIQHLNQVLSENSHLECFDSLHFRAEGTINRWEKVENATVSKELRAVQNLEKWQQFLHDLGDIEKWLLDSLQNQSHESVSTFNMEKFLQLLQKHQALISEIEQHKKSIIALNAASQKFSSILKSQNSLTPVNEKLKAVNEHWDKLCLSALEWQNKLLSKFLECPELTITLQEMELWLKESKEKVLSVPLNLKDSGADLYDLHTELFAMKQQLESCQQQVKMLCHASTQLFQDGADTRLTNMQSKLIFISEESQNLLHMSAQQLALLDELLLNSESFSSKKVFSTSPEEGRPTRIRQCCQYLFRVARASIPIQAILFLLLGAAILIPKDEEELSCRLSNNFASSLNTMLRYPDGPPPV